MNFERKNWIKICRWIPDEFLLRMYVLYSILQKSE
jgi:hypothetical protein